MLRKETVALSVCAYTEKETVDQIVREYELHNDISCAETRERSVRNKWELSLITHSIQHVMAQQSKMWALIVCTLKCKP